MFEELVTTAEIEMFVNRAYNGRQRVAEMAPGDRLSPALPLSVAEAGPLIERAVAVADGDGLTLQELRRIFKPLGKERWERALKVARTSGNISESTELRPNRAGRPQRQVVFRKHVSD